MKKLGLSLIYLLSFSYAYTQDSVQLYTEWENMHNSKANLFKEYNELKFGMFIHWGVYSKLGGTWKGEKIIPETHRWATIGEWIMYSAEIPRQEYREVAKTFNPVKFDAGEWVNLAKEAGMRYLVITAKHHDGFSMYHSGVSDYNIYDFTPFNRDPLEEIYAACKKYGIRMGIYYSHSIDWMDGGDAGIAQAKEANPELTDTRAANTWDPSPSTYREYIENKAKPQVRELLNKFPELVEIWYDFPRYMNLHQSFEFYKLAYEYQPECLVNSRVGNDLGDYLVAGDNQIPSEIDGKYKTWETPGTMNNTWGFKSYDNDWKSLNEVLFWIVEIASKGGNYLLNIGPDGNGIIPEASVNLLKMVGEWMKTNGEAIYGTGRWITLKEGPTKVEAKGTSYRREHGFTANFTPEDFWFTRKDNFVYVISLVDPVGNKASIKSLINCQENISGIKLLGSKKTLKWDTSSDKLDIYFPVNTKNKNSIPGYVLKVEMKK
jgi:alpha-L-fucosidase